MLFHAVLALILAIPAAAPQQPAQSDEQAIAALHAADTAATQAFDVEALLALLDDQVVALMPGQPPLQGKDSMRAFLSEGKKAAADLKVLDYRQDWKELRINGDYAYEWGAFHERVQPSGGAEVKMSFNVLRILKRQPSGGWKVYRTIWNELPQAAAKP